MKVNKLIAILGGGAILSLGMMSTASAVIPTNVQYSTTGVGTGTTGYDITGINQFDWQSSGDLAVNNVSSGGTSFTSFQSFVAAELAAAVGQSIAIGTTTALTTGVGFDINAQARLNDMLASGGGSVAPGTLNTSGTGAGFEITAALTGSETANFQLIVSDTNNNGIIDATEVSAATQLLTFLTISGNYQWFHDTSPNSNVATGAGFINGTTILTGSLTGVSGTVGVFNGVFSGNTLLTDTVTSYNSAFIQTDPSANAPLVGTTFNTLMALAAPLQAQVGVGGVIGLGPHTVTANDLLLKADANSTFAANPVPEPHSLLLLAIGLLGLGATANRKNAAC